jgi:hypothetical protein
MDQDQLANPQPLVKAEYPYLRVLAYVYFLTAILFIFTFFLNMLNAYGLGFLYIFSAIPISIIAFVYFFVARNLLCNQFISRSVLTLIALFSPLFALFTLSDSGRGYNVLLLIAVGVMTVIIFCFTLFTIYFSSKNYFKKTLMNYSVELAEAKKDKRKSILFWIIILTLLSPVGFILLLILLSKL